jgi:hypothetical protein
MIAFLIFLLLLATGLSGLRDKRWVTLSLFFACWIAIALLFMHHATDPLNISL